jgi:hypothetical protein
VRSGKGRRGAIGQTVPLSKPAPRARLFQEVVRDVTLDLESVLSSAELYALFGLVSDRR